MKNNNNPALTEGPILQTLVTLALPIMASSFLSTAYNITDMAWVGTLGAKAVAGVGIGGVYLWFSQGFATMARMGGQVLAAQAIGGRRIEEAKAYAKASLQLLVIMALLYSAFSLLFTGQMIGFFKITDQTAFRAAFSYTRITCGLIIFPYLNWTLTSLYTAMGDSKTPLFANFTGLVLNMILDPLLILGPGILPKLGTNGAAVATVFSQAVVVGTLILKSRKAENSLFAGQRFLQMLPLSYYKEVLHIGFPAGIQNLLYCFFSMILNRFVSAFCADALAVQRVGGQIEAISWNTADGFGAALNAFCGQNYGAKKFDRIKRGYGFSSIVTFGWGALVMICFLLFPEPISRVFFHEKEAIAIAVSYVTIVGLSQPFMVVEMATGGAMSGLGKTKICSVLSIVFTGIRIPIAYILQGTFLGLNGIWWALSSTSICKGFIFFGTFMWIVYREAKKYKEI